jgi:hypothetical protein
MKQIAISLAAGLLVGAVLTYYFMPSKNTIQVKEVTKDVIQHDIVTVVKVVKQPDGATDTTTITTDKSTEAKDTKVSEAIQTQALKKTVVSGLVGVDSTVSLKPIYGLIVTHEVFGNITVGVFGMTNGVGGLSLGVSF